MVPQETGEGMWKQCPARQGRREKGGGGGGRGRRDKVRAMGPQGCGDTPDIVWYTAEGTSTAIL